MYYLFRLNVYPQYQPVTKQVEVNITRFFWTMQYRGTECPRILVQFFSSLRSIQTEEQYKGGPVAQFFWLKTNFFAASLT